MCGTVRFCRVSLVHSHRHDDEDADVVGLVDDAVDGDVDGENVDDDDGGIFAPFGSSDGLGDGFGDGLDDGDGDGDETVGAEEGAFVALFFDRSFLVPCTRMSSSSRLPFSTIFSL